ncbi:flagellar basal body rod protein FlgB [Clostridium sp. 19966]|uniref:flagellar basal body rod protein FlgB n=1 Tax=Clostridium sp. 19966 TaxID=2768166 RepID=UPI0028DEFF07|nr:flagellar basal body rod protein FlgB [Clostridium sp. 19966]MDT8716660.1 flagellar basal body rod protein FlgB [Clostridium sp. 19966]
MEINAATYDQKVYNLIKKGLDASMTRSNVMANNIANVNTKGYKRYYVSFEDALNSATDNLKMETSDPLHISDSDNEGQITIKQDTSTSMNLDGNNVDVDQEMSNLAANTLYYNALATQINSELSMSRSVINGGK